MFMDSTSFRLNLAKTYVNAMEILVEEEVDRRFEQLSKSEKVYLNRMEVVSYALNQLPPLYATSKNGLHYQRQQGREQQSTQIQRAVQQALAAVVRDPIMRYEPLKFQAPAGLRDALSRIRVILHNEQVNWETLPHIMALLLRRIPKNQQTAAVNAGVSAQRMRENVETVDGYDHLFPEEDTGIIGVSSPGLGAQSDKPWKRFRENVGAHAGSTAASQAWEDSRYWK